MQKNIITQPPYKSAVELLFDASELGGFREIYAKVCPDGVRRSAIRIFYKGHFKDGTDHYEVAINRELVDEMDAERKKLL